MREIGIVKRRNECVVYSYNISWIPIMSSTTLVISSIVLNMTNLTLLYLTWSFWQKRQMVTKTVMGIWLRIQSTKKKKSYLCGIVKKRTFQIMEQYANSENWEDLVSLKKNKILNVANEVRRSYFVWRSFKLCGCLIWAFNQWWSTEVLLIDFWCIISF